MEYSKLLDLATDLGYNLAMSGAETFRVEESISRILKAYDIDAEVFVIPNCMHISIEPVVGRPLTRMRRIANHGNDLDAVERFSGLSRRICSEHPAPEIAEKWLEEAKAQKKTYPLALYLAGDFLGAFGFAMIFGGSVLDAFFSGICGLMVGLINKFMESLDANQFFRTIAAAYPMALLAYVLGAAGLTPNPDAVIIGGLMLLVPGLIFTNGMRDIIFGDTNSGVNRFVQVLLIAVAISLGTAAAWNTVYFFLKEPIVPVPSQYSILVECIPCMLACLGFSILFNIHGYGGLLCVLGGVITWAIYKGYLQLGGNDLMACFWATLFSSVYAESMARIRKYPAISYLVVSIFPLLPGAGVYYTMHYAVVGNMDKFVSEGFHTAAVAGIMALSILLASTSFRLWAVWKHRYRK